MKPEPAKDDLPKLELDGRVRMGAVLERGETELGSTQLQQDRLSLALVEARFGAAYQAYEWLSLDLELEVAKNPELKDAFVRVQSKRLRGQFGQFKMPVSALALESPWRLPIAHRGVIQELLVEHVQMLGRRQGVSGRYRARGGVRPELTLGAFQGMLANTRDPLLPDFSATETVDSQNLVARLGARLGELELALMGERISTLVAARVRHFWALGLDATADYELTGHGIRFFVEAFTGSTWKSAGGGSSQPEIRFGTSRALVAWRAGGLRKGQLYIEPFLFGGVLDPDLESRRDLVWEMQTGVSGGLWREFRVTLQGELIGSQPDVAEQFFSAARVLDRKALELQVGAAF